jgi:hypothetical protein
MNLGKISDLLAQIIRSLPSFFEIHVKRHPIRIPKVRLPQSESSVVVHDGIRECPIQIWDLWDLELPDKVTDPLV